MTSFQKKIYKIVRKIPRGKVMTYAEVAQAAGSLRAWRGVGNILNKNQDTNVPCHRVIRANGKIGGFRNGQRRKIELLKEEGINIKKGKIVP